MKSAIIPRAEMRAALATLSRVVERRNTIPVLSNIRLATVNGRVIATGTDLDIVMSATIAGAAGDDDFAVTLPAHKLADLEKRAPATEMLAIDAHDPDGKAARLDFDGVRVSMAAIPASDFPDLEEPANGAAFTMPTADLLALLSRTSAAISTEETRYYLNGVFLHVMTRGNRRLLRAVTTDGHRLICHDVDAPDQLADMPGAIVPRKAVHEMIRLAKAKGAPPTCDLIVSANRIRLTIGNIVMVSKLIDGTFPDYARVLPTGNDKRVTLESSALAVAIDAVCCVSNERSRAVKFTMAPGALTLTVANPDMGTATTTIAAEYDGPEMEIGFNGGYLLDLIGALDSDRVTMALADSGSPTLMTDPDDGDTFAVLMPMRV